MRLQLLQKEKEAKLKRFRDEVRHRVAAIDRLKRMQQLQKSQSAVNSLQILLFLLLLLLLLLQFFLFSFYVCTFIKL